MRRLALAKLRELRRAGMSYREIGRQFALEPGRGGEHSAGGYPFRLPPERLLRPERDAGATRDGALFLRALDALEGGIAFFSLGGEPLHANRAFTREMARAPLPAEVENFARALASLVALRGLAAETVVESLDTRDLPREVAPLRLRGSYIGLDLFGRGGTLLIALEDPPPALLSDETLAARFCLSKKESAIARLLVDGRSNAEIAARLFISPHTARHHTERILRKLDARSRTEAVSRLLRQGEE